ncbi:hypothetical protein LXL04_018053 [Taraxacum kok-saghyz]
MANSLIEMKTKSQDLLRTHIFPRTRELPSLFCFASKPLKNTKFFYRSLYNTYLKSCTYAKVKKKYRFFGKKFQRIVMIKNVLEGSEVGFLKGITIQFLGCSHKWTGMEDNGRVHKIRFNHLMSIITHVITSSSSSSELLLLPPDRSKSQSLFLIGIFFIIATPVLPPQSNPYGINWNTRPQFLIQIPLASRRAGTDLDFVARFTPPEENMHDS